MAEAPHHHKRRSWFHPSRPSSSSGRPSSSSGGRSRPGSSSGGSGSWSISLPAPPEGQQLDLSRPATPATEHAPPHHGVPFTRSETYDSPPVSRPTTPRRLSAIVLTSSFKQGGDDNNNKEDGFQPLVRAQSAQPQLSSVRSHESSTGKGHAQGYPSLSCLPIGQGRPRARIRCPVSICWSHISKMLQSVQRA